MEHHNITIRKKKKKIFNKARSYNSLNSSNSSYDDVMSLTDVSTNCDEQEIIKGLKEEINTLKMELESAHNEIDKLNIDINVLETQSKEYKQQIDRFKTILTSPLKKNTTQKKVKEKLIQLENNIQKSNKQGENSKQKSNKQDETLVTELQKTKTQHKNNFKKITQDKIVIYGGQTCRNLASKIIKSREFGKKQQKKYYVTSTIKPNATTEEILKHIKQEDFGMNDYIILGIGENDKNPTKTLVDLSVTLDKLVKHKVFVLSVYRNKFLNEIKLNSSLKLLCSQFANCVFIDFINERMYDKLHDTINFNIDLLEYNNIYLNYNSNKINKTSNYKQTQYSTKTMVDQSTQTHFENKTKIKDKCLLSDTSSEDFFRL